MRRRQLEPSQSSTAGMPAKLNLSQLRRHAWVKDWDEQCCRPLLLSYRNSIPAVAAAMSQVHRQHMRATLYGSESKRRPERVTSAFAGHRNGYLLVFSTALAKTFSVQKIPKLITKNLNETNTDFVRITRTSSGLWSGRLRNRKVTNPKRAF